MTAFGRKAVVRRDIQMPGWNPEELAVLATAKLEAPGVSNHDLTGQNP